MPLTIRRARPADAPALVRGNAEMAHESEGVVLDEGTLARGVAALLADPARGFYLVAERDGRQVGQLMVTFEWSDWRDGLFWWIQSVHVVREARRTGVYRALHDEVARLAREADCCGLRLYVERENSAAHATYESVGMQRTRYLVYEQSLPRRAPP